MRPCGRMTSRTSFSTSSSGCRMVSHCQRGEVGQRYRESQGGHWGVGPSGQRAGAAQLALHARHVCPSAAHGRGGAARGRSGRYHRDDTRIVLGKTFSSAAAAVPCLLRRSDPSCAADPWKLGLPLGEGIAVKERTPLCRILHRAGATGRLSPFQSSRQLARSIRDRCHLKILVPNGRHIGKGGAVRRATPLHLQNRSERPSPQTDNQS